MFGSFLALTLFAAAGPTPVAVPVITPAIVSLEDLSRADRRRIDRYNLCGMLVRAQARQPGGVTHEWDVAVTVFRRGDQPVAAVEAAAFAFERRPEDRVVRAALAEMGFAVQGAAAAGSTQLLDGPNSDGGMVGEMAVAAAEQVFDALDAGAPIRLDLTYVTGMRETLLLRTRGRIISFWGHFAHGRSAPVHLCLAKLVPAAGPPGPTRRAPHPA